MTKKLWAIGLLALISLASCQPAGGVTAVIVGSAESPDPVLVEVQRLERQGVVRDVVVMESFPCQIQLTASQAVIDNLNQIPRKRLKVNP